MKVQMLVIIIFTGVMITSQLIQNQKVAFAYLMVNLTVLNVQLILLHNHPNGTKDFVAMLSIVLP